MADTYTGADLFVDALEQYGVTHLFGNPGTTELPIMTALEDGDLEYVLGLHEDVAVGMAAGYARTRSFHAARDPSVNPVGVVNLHVAPGLAHGLGNVYDANRGNVPLVVTAGDHRTDARHREPVLSGELAEMARTVTKWSDDVDDIAALPTMIRRAVRTALSPPTGPVFLGLPLDVMMAETDDEPVRLGSIPDAGRGDADEIERAADLVADADDVALVVGDGVGHAGPDGVDAAVAFAEAAGARVHGEILTAQGNFPSTHDQWVSFVPSSAEGAIGTMDADVLVLAGCSTNTPVTGAAEEFIPEETTVVQIGADAWELGKNEPADASVIGDPGAILGELATLTRERVSRADRESRLDTVEQRKREFHTDDDPVDDDPRPSKAELVDALFAAAPDPYIVDESVTTKYVMLKRSPLGPEDWMGNKGGGLGYGLSASVGAAIAERERPIGEPRDVIGLVGDGSYLYYPHALYSAARYNVDLTVVVPDNRNYRILKDNTLALLGGREEDYEFIGMDFDPNVDIPANAVSHGASGRLVEPGDDIEATIADAVAEDGPTVVDVLVHD